MTFHFGAWIRYIHIFLPTFVSVILPRTSWRQINLIICVLSFERISAIFHDHIPTCVEMRERLGEGNAIHRFRRR